MPSRKNLFDAARVQEIKERLARLRPESPRQWGKMNAAQAVAHCGGAVEMALGDLKPPRMPIGRLIGWAIKPLALRNDDPFKRNSPTVPGLERLDERELDTERKRLYGLIDRFATAGAEKCTGHPHSFFGKLTPEEWAVLMYKHLDHHLRQFGE